VNRLEFAKAKAWQEGSIWTLRGQTVTRASRKKDMRNIMGSGMAPNRDARLVDHRVSATDSIYKSVSSFRANVRFALKLSHDFERHVAALCAEVTGTGIRTEIRLGCAQSCRSIKSEIPLLEEKQEQYIKE